MPPEQFSINLSEVIGWMNVFTANTTRLITTTMLSSSEAIRRLVEEINMDQLNHQDEGGTTMPNASAVRETITLPVTEQTRRVIAERMDLARVLAEQVDEATWLEHLNRLRSAASAGTWRVRRGAMQVDEYPRVLYMDPSGRERGIDLTTVPVSVARQYIEVASDGRLTIPDPDEHTTRADQREVYLYFEGRNAIETEAYIRWNQDNYGGGLYVRTVGSETAWSVDIPELVSQMNAFANWLRATNRRDYLREAIRRRMAREVVTDVEESWTDERREKFAKFFDGLRAGLRPEENSFRHLPILPRKTLSSRTWGIEIEAVDIEGVDTPEYWELKGDGSLRNLSVSSMPSRTMPGDDVSEPEPFDHPLPPDDHDESCSCYDFNDELDDYDDCDCGYYEAHDEYELASREWRRNNPQEMSSPTETGEWNSPVLRSYHSRGLKHLCDHLEPRRTNNSAGIHVHVGAEGLTASQAIQLSIMYSALEPLFEAEYMRGDTRNYCKSVDLNEMLNRFEQARILRQEAKGRHTVPLGRDMRFHSRYWTVNLASLESHDTVEFRAMGPVYNYDHLVRWAYLCRELVNLAMAEVPQSAWRRVRTMQDLVSLFAKYGKETPTPEWDKKPRKKAVEQVIEELGTENRRIPNSRPLSPTKMHVNLVNDDYSSREVALKRRDRRGY